MKRIIWTISIVLASVLIGGFTLTPNATLKGAWKMNDGILLCTDNYFSLAHFDVQKKRFDRTIGGTYNLNGNTITLKIEFSYPDTTLVGESLETTIDIKDNKFLFKNNDILETWEKIPEENGSPLSALWQIVGREQKDGAMGEIKRGARKTIKILTQNRFQWIALNTETKVFSGTGGGTYTFKDGKYTETIEFFSRDSSRVGMSLSFDSQVEGDKWYHTGKSSKGDRVHEIWQK